VAGEMRDPRRDLSRGLVVGVIGVIVLYLAVNFVCLRVLGPDGLAATRTPASAVMRAALGERGAQWIELGIAIKLRPAEIEKQLADLAIVQSVQAITQCASQNHCPQSINGAPRLAQFPLTFD
jgi:hypothetical protein